MGMVATSCQQEVDLGVKASGELAEVSLNVQAPTMVNRAYSDGLTATHLQYAVYDEAGNILNDLTVTDATINGSATVQLQLVTGNTYSVLFWAAAPNAPYTVDLANKTMEVSYTGAVCSDENRDAFYKYHTFTVSGAQTETIELKRPFAQLNIGTNDYEKAAHAGLTVTHAKVATSAYTTLDLATGDVDGLTDVEFAYAAAPTSETFPVDNYQYLAMNYLLMATDKETVEVTFYYATDESGANAKSRTVGSIPVQRNYRTNLYGALFTSLVDFNVVIEPEYDEPAHDVLAPVLVASAAAAQKALDNAVAGSVVKLQPGVNYGTLYLRPYAGGTATKNVDWIGNNYGWETYTLFENLTIIGAEGATVDAIQIEGGTYYHTAHSQASTYPVMLSLVELKNVVFDGVTFTGKGGYDPQGYGNAVNLSGGNIKVDGLTFKNCVLKNSENNARLLYKTESTTNVHNYAYTGETFTFSPSLKDITITGCTLDGGYIGIELRETENVTITNNVFNVADRNILLPVNTGCTYSGEITITGNVSNNAKERFVRADGTGDAVVVIKNNTIIDYEGEDVDYIKVSNGNNVTVEDNVFGANVTNATELDAAIVNGATIILAEGTYVLPAKTKNKTLTFVGSGDPAATVIATNTSGSYEGCNYNLSGSTVLFENVSITTDNRTYTGYAGCNATFKNCVINNSITLYGDTVFENCTLNVSGDQYNVWTWAAHNVTFNNCVFNSDGKALLLYGSTATTDLTVNGCTFNDTGVLPDLKAAIEIGCDYGLSHFNVVVNNTVVNGYEITNKGINTGTTLWGNKNSIGQDRLNVVVDGVDVY